MSTRDSHLSFVHLEDSNHLLYMEKWQDDPIPFDYIDTSALFANVSGSLPPEMFEEEEDGEIPLMSQNFGAKAMKDRKSLQARTWQDLDIFDRFHPNAKGDATQLAPLYSALAGLGADVGMMSSPHGRHGGLDVADFLSNGFAAGQSMMMDKDISTGDIVNDSIIGTHPGDFSLNSTEIIVPSSSFNVNRALSGSSQTNSLQTPRPARRQPSVDRNFQTPITRIIR